MSNHICHMDECQRPARAFGLCATHYARWQKHGDPFYEYVPPKHQICWQENCIERGQYSGLCPNHRYALDKHGDVNWTYDHREEDSPTRVCSTCGIEKPNDEMCRHPECVGKTTRQCKKCKAKYDAEYRELRREQRRESNRRRKAIMFGADAETIDMDVLWDKSKGICDLCSESIDRLLCYPDPRSPSIDHIVPLSRGGTHTMNNVRITHFICNVRRGIARGEEFELQTR